MFTWGFKSCDSGFPHKIKNPVLGRSISTVETDYIHGSVSVIGGPARSISTVGRSISIGAYPWSGGYLNWFHHTHILNNICVNNQYNQKSI